MYKDPQTADFINLMRSINAEGNSIPDNECEQAEECDACDVMLPHLRHESRRKPKPRMKMAGRSEGVYCYSGG